MSQQYQSPMGSAQQPYGQQTGATGRQFGGSTGSQRFGSSHESTHRTVGQQFESEMTPELNKALESFDRVVEIAEWCADKCIESPQMAECARLCEDLADLASLNEKLIARDSINGPEVAEAFLTVAEQGMPILEQYQQSRHVQETYQAVRQAVDATNRLLDSIGSRRPQTGIREQVQGQGQQMRGQQMRGQSFGQGMPSQQSGSQPYQSSQPY